MHRINQSGHHMHFPEVFDAISLDTGEAIHSDRFH